MKFIKYFLLSFLLVISFSGLAETPAEWNYRFSVLNNNNPPLNLKWDATQQQKYLRGILTGPVGKMYLNPDDYPPVAPPKVPVEPLKPAIVSDPVSLEKTLVNAKSVVTQLEVLIEKQPK